MFAEETVYVNELCLTDVPELRKTYLQFRCPCRWACRERPLSQHFQMSPERTGNPPGQLLPNPPHRPPSAKHTRKHIQGLCSGTCPGTAVLSRSSALFHLCFSAVWGKKNCGFMSQRMEWAQWKDSSVLPPAGFNHQRNCTEHSTCLRFLGFICVFISTAVSFHRITSVATKEDRKKVPRVPEKRRHSWRTAHSFFPAALTTIATWLWPWWLKTVLNIRRVCDSSSFGFLCFISTVAISLQGIHLLPQRNVEKKRTFFLFSLSIYLRVFVHFLQRRAQY